MESYSRGEVVKKAKVFTMDELTKFFREADDKNRYLLVRKVVAMMAVLGANRLGELRNMTMDSLRKRGDGKGWVVSFQHLKQRGHIETSK